MNEESIIALCVLFAALMGGVLVWAWSLRKALLAAQQEAAAHAAHNAAVAREFGPYMADVTRLHQLQVELQQADAQRNALQSSLALSEQESRARIAQWESSAAEGVRQRTAAAQQMEQQLSLRLAELQQAVSSLEEQADLQSMGMYRPRYDFGSASEFEAALDGIREQQKAMQTGRTAAVCSTRWHVDGDARAGERLVQDQLKLMLRAFNGECDAAVAKVKFNNFATLERRLQASFDAINKVGASKQCAITPEYLSLKLQELSLVHEYQEKRQEEIEEQRAIREQMREEERAAREIETARIEAEREERRYQIALEKARREAEAATGRQRDALEIKIAELTQQLADATAKQKAISQAQLTSVGHVYIISNIGSFGEDVYKIGMTRRLDPMERVIELGDASVPFPFDVHAMIYTANAPELERSLHQRFTAQRVNLVNNRKEYFRVSLEDIERAAKEIVARQPDQLQRPVAFVRTAMAADYRKSVALRAGRAPDPPAPPSAARARAAQVS